MDASKTLSDPMRRVLDALYAGLPAPPDAQSALSETERAEVASLARTAHLTRLTLNQPDPPAEAEAASLRKAQTALANRPATTMRPTTEDLPPPATWLETLRARFRGRGNGG